MKRKSSLTIGVLKTLSVFSGMEAVNIVCSMVKMKFVALWLQAAGVGLFGIYNTTIELVSILTGLGIRQSGVREVAIHQHGGMLERVVARVRAWSLAGGLIGALVLTGLSPVLSGWLMGDYSGWWHFALLGAVLLFNTLIAGEQAILQGSGKIPRIARASVRASVAGLAVSIPLFRYAGQTSVIYSILAYSLFGLLFVILERNREISDRPPRVSDLREGKTMVSLGAYMAVAGFLTLLAQIIFLGFLNRTASESEVGYYQAGVTLVVRYTTILFAAVAVEFYPRLSAHHGSAWRTEIFVSHEIVLLMLVFMPLLLLFLTFKTAVIHLLYTSEFLVIIPFITIGIFSVIFRGISTCLAYTIVARGDGRTYFVTEGLDACIGLCLNIVCYLRWGLPGVGVALVAWYLIYTLIVGGVYLFRYRLRLRRGAVCHAMMAVTAGGASVIADMFYPSLWVRLLMLVVAAVYFYYLWKFIRRK